MLRKIAPLLLLCLLLTAFGCGKTTTEPPSTYAEQTTEQTTDAAQTAIAAETTPAPDILGTWYHYEEGSHPDEYAPALTFNGDGTYHFLVNLLEGMGNVTGTYEVLDGVAVCTVDSIDFWGFLGDGATVFRCSVGENALTYDGDAFGVTGPGAVFTREKT